MKWFLVLMLISFNAFSQEQQLIIRIPQQNEHTIMKIGRQLSCVDGVHFSGYVNHASCILLRYNKAIVKDEQIITSVIYHLNHKLRFEVIKGYTAYEVIDGRLSQEPLSPNQ